MGQYDTQLAAWLQASGPTETDLLSGQGDWDRFTSEVCQARLAGLVLEHASRRDRTLPPQVSSELQRRAMTVAAYNMNLSAELERIVGILGRANIPVMLLKGAALNLTVYARPDLRPMSDLDLLIRPEDAGATLQLLADYGCRQGCDLLREGFFPKYHYEMELITDPPKSARIDLHARPLRPLRISRTMPDQAIWEEAVTVRVGESQALVPCPEVMFIHLAAHAAFHGCSRLLWLYDLKRLVDVHEHSLDWSVVAKRAGRWGLSLPVLRAVESAGELLGPVCPTVVIEELAAQPATWRDRLVLAHAPHDRLSPVVHVMLNMLCTPGIRFRAGYLFALLRPGRAHLGDVYPYRHAGWVICAHAWRVLRFAGRAAHAPWHGLAQIARRIARVRLDQQSARSTTQT